MQLWCIIHGTICRNIGAPVYSSRKTVVYTLRDPSPKLHQGGESGDHQQPRGGVYAERNIPIGDGFLRARCLNSTMAQTI